MDGRSRPFGSGLEPESTGSGCWAKEEEKMTPMMRWCGRVGDGQDIRGTQYTPLAFQHLNSPRLQSAVGAVINASSSRTVGRVAGPSYGGLSVRFYQLIWLRLTTTTHNHRRDPDPLSPLLYLLSYLCCQRRLLGSHPCRWALVLVTRGFCQPATTHAGREHTRVKHRVSRSITLLADKFSYYHQ